MVSNKIPNNVGRKIYIFTRYNQEMFNRQARTANVVVKVRPAGTKLHVKCPSSRYGSTITIEIYKLVL